MRASNVLAAASLTLLVTFGAAGDAAWSQKVGTTGAVNPASTGTPPGGGSRTLEIGGDVVYRERIRTTASGSLQVLFVDTTTLTVGPNSDLTIDQFVFDPGAGSGTFIASLAKGSLRFVGGKISHTAGATIKTPVATMGIRGGVTFIAVDGAKFEAICGAGSCTVDPNASGLDTVNVPQGQGFQISSDGTAGAFTPTSQGLQNFTQSITQGTQNANSQQSASSAGITEGAGAGQGGGPAVDGPGDASTDPDTIPDMEIDDLVQEAEPVPDEPRGQDEEPPPPPIEP